MSRKVRVVVEVTVDDDAVSDQKVSELVEMMLEVGQADASATAEQPDLDETQDAKLASGLSIDDVYVPSN